QQLRLGRFRSAGGGKLQRDTALRGADGSGVRLQPDVPLAGGDVGDALADRAVVITQDVLGAGDYGDLDTERGQHVRELGGDRATAQDDRALRQRVQPHDGVRGVILD